MKQSGAPPDGDDEAAMFNVVYAEDHSWRGVFVKLSKKIVSGCGLLLILNRSVSY